MFCLNNVVCAEGMKLFCRNVVRKHEGKRFLGINIVIWEDDIKMDLKELEIADWTRVAEDKTKV